MTAVAVDSPTREHGVTQVSGVWARTKQTSIGRFWLQIGGIYGGSYVSHHVTRSRGAGAMLADGKVGRDCNVVFSVWTP